MASLAIRWVLDHPAVSVVIPGATKPQQVVQNAKASMLPPLSSDLHSKLRTFFHQEVEGHIRGPV